MTTQKIRGVVKWFSAEKGYGFISRAKGNDVFVHHSDLLMDGYRKLEEGDVVEFDLDEAKEHGGKVKAINVERIE